MAVTRSMATINNKKAETMKYKKPLLIIAGLISFYAILGFFVIPWVIKAKLPEIIEEQTGKIGSITEARFNPFTLTLSLKGFEMKEPNDEKIIGLGELFINYGVVNSFAKLAVAVDGVRLTEPYANIKIRKDGSLNLADLAKPGPPEEEPEESEESDEPFPVWVKDIKIETGEIDFADLSLDSPFKTEITPLNLHVQNLTTKVSDDEQGLSLSMKLGRGGSLDWKGDLELNPTIKSNGLLEIKELNGHTFWDYAKDQLNFKIQKGKLDIKTNYAFHLEGDQPQLTLSDAAVHLNDFNLTPKDSNQSVISIPDFSLTGISFDLIKQLVVINKVDSKAAKFTTHISKDGEVNFNTLFAGKSPKEPVKEPEKKTESESSKPWLVKVVNVALSDYAVDFTQETEGDPLKLDLSPITIGVSDFSTKPGNQFGLDIQIGVNKTGKINTKGKVAIDPVSAQLDIKANQLGLKAFQPYLDESTKLKLLKGSVDLDNKLDFKLDQDGKPSVNLTGNASINNLETIEAKSKKEFLSWKTVTLDDMKFSLDPMKLDIAKIDIFDISSKVIIYKDKTTNISKIFPGPKKTSQPKEKKKEQKPKSKDENPFDLNIGAINFANGTSYFADRSIIIPFAANIKRLNGYVKNISTDKKSRSKVLLKGKVNRVSPVLIKGSVSPFDVEDHLDMQMSFKGLDMTTATPYMAEFAGYKIEKGKLSLDLGYKIKRKSLNATNKVVINQLTLGDEVESPNSVSVPIKLGIGLLKDANGVIDIDLPIEGRLDDPQFSVFGLVGKVLLNLLTKAVTAPFSMMASLVGSDADLSRVEFEAGRSEVSEEQQTILSTVAKGLSKRPQLQLEVRGIAYQENDGKALADQKVMRDIKSVKWEDLDEDERPPKLDDVELDDEEYHEILSDLFEDRFPDQSDELIDKAEDAPDPATAKSFYEEIKQKMVAATSVGEDALEELANRRATSISLYLTEKTKTSVERIFILDHAIKPKAENDEVITELKIGIPD